MTKRNRKVRRPLPLKLLTPVLRLEHSYQARNICKRLTESRTAIANVAFQLPPANLTVRNAVRMNLLQAEFDRAQLQIAETVKHYSVQQIVEDAAIADTVDGIACAGYDASKPFECGDWDCDE